MRSIKSKIFFVLLCYKVILHIVSKTYQTIDFEELREILGDLTSMKFFMTYHISFYWNCMLKINSYFLQSNQTKRLINWLSRRTGRKWKIIMCSVQTTKRLSKPRILLKKSSLMVNLKSIWRFSKHLNFNILFINRL